MGAYPYQDVDKKNQMHSNVLFFTGGQAFDAILFHFTGIDYLHEDLRNNYVSIFFIFVDF